MQKQKGVSAINGIAIILAVVLIAFGGVFAYQYFTKSQIPNFNNQQNLKSQNLNAETAGSALSEIEGWKTYKNDEYGFEFQYPDSFKEYINPREFDDDESVSKLSKYFLYNKNSEKLEFKVNFNYQFDPNNLVSGRYSVKYEKSEISINGIRSYKVKSATCYMGCGSGIMVFIPYKTGAIIFTTARADPDESLTNITSQEEMLFNQIISTFKFTK